jgi:hypothetical protein
LTKVINSIVKAILGLIIIKTHKERRGYHFETGLPEVISIIPELTAMVQGNSETARDYLYHLKNQKS